MLEQLIQLTILFFVIIDPFASFVVFITATQSMKPKEKRKIAIYAVLVAVSLSYLVLFFGSKLLELFSTTLDEFRIAGGAVLCILGVKMALGKSIVTDNFKDNSGRAMASIIGTPLLTGPATITAILISIADYGKLLTGSAVGIVLLFTAIIFFLSSNLSKVLGKTVIQVLSTLLGLITLAWGVKFITVGIQHIF